MQSSLINNLLFWMKLYKMYWTESVAPIHWNNTPFIYLSPT